MNTEQIFENLKNAIIQQNEDKAKKAAHELLEYELDPLIGIEKGLSPGMDAIGDKFNTGECFLPELIQAGDAFNAAISVLEPEIAKRGDKQDRVGVVVMGTVKGDIHKIGKDIFIMLLKTRGFEVHDLGEDVSMSSFVNKAEEVNADIIGMSSLLTTTMPAQREVIDLLKEKGIRDKYAVMVGGGPVNQKWADEIGADAYSETAEEAVRIAAELVSAKK